MLYDMCHDVLSAADVKAICKSRGLSNAALTSRSVLEQVFLSTTGVASALNSLAEAEVAALHLLRLHDHEVDVTFFERLYSDTQARQWAYGTFTQQYKPIYDAVQRNLVRKGVLLIAPPRTNAPTKTKMELWRYRFPTEFAPLLPPLFSPHVHAGGAGVVTADRVRAALHRLAQEEQEKQPSPPLQLRRGNLTIGTRPFSVAAVQDWRQGMWESAIGHAQYQQKDQSYRYAIFQGYLLPENEYHTPSPLPTLLYAFAQLGPDEWLLPDQLNVLLDLVYAHTAHPSAATICEAGWEAGCLARYEANGKAYYRRSEPAYPHAQADPEQYLRLADGMVCVDLDRVPYAMLELLNSIAALEASSGRLAVVPSFGKLVHGWSSVRDHALLRYLRAHSAAFAAECAKLETAWGRLIVHENLLVARGTDLSLRVALQQALRGDGGASSAQPVVLSDEYLVFPRARQGEIERLVKKAGHVVKTVRAS
jgi:hypothetical protein